MKKKSCSVILPVVASVMLFALLAFLSVNVNFEIQQSRMGDGLVVVDEEKKHNYLRQLFFDLRQTLENVGIDSIVIQNNYSYALDIEKIDCDYYAYLKDGKPEFYGEYMIQYSWAEETCGLLWERTEIL